MTLQAWVAIILAGGGLLLVAFLTLWRKAGREVREMERFDQRRAGIDKAQVGLSRPRRVR